MTREQAKANLVKLGIAEPSEQDISNYLDQINGETNRERARADQYKSDASKVTELQKQLDALNAQNMTDLEKANKERDDALKSVADVKKQLAHMQTLNALAEKGITGDDAKNLIRDDGSLDFDTLGKILTDRATAAAAAKEKELLNSTPNPGGGGKGGSDPNGKTHAELLAERIAAKPEANADIINHYISGGN